MIESALRLLVIAFTVAHLRGDEDSPWSVRIELMVVSVPAKVALKCVPALRGRETTAQAVKEINEMIGSGKATLYGMPVVWCRNGERAVTESHEEIRFPTEPEIHVMQSFGNNAPVYLPMPWPLPTYRGLDTPAGFETRNAGLALEIESEVIEEGSVIVANLSAKHTTLDKWRRVLRSPNDPAAGIYEQPQFRTFTTTTRIDLVSGEWMLLGVFVIPKPADRAELFLIRGTATAFSK